MSENEVQISLPIAVVRRAWERYAGIAGDNGDFTATFTSDGPALTTLAVDGPDAAQAPEDLLAGFVAYVDAVHHELDAPPVSTVGDGPVGPDGTPHVEGQPTGLGTDGRTIDDAGQWGESPAGA